MTVLSTAWRYGLAVISCGIALALAIPLDSPSSCFFLAVMVSSLYGGKGPGVLSVLLSALAFDYFFIPPKYDLWIQPSSYPRLAVFLGSVLLIMVVIEAKRRVEEARRLRLLRGARRGRDAEHDQDIVLAVLERASSAERAKALHQRAHDFCFIANSVNFPVHHEATVEEVVS